MTYTGPYADFLQPRGVRHEIYTARRLPDGTLTGDWTGEPATGYVALVGACTCRWHSQVERPPGPYNSQAFHDALHDAKTQHLDRLVAEAAHRFWPTWTDRVARASNTIARHMALGNTRAAMEMLTELSSWVRAASRVAGRAAARADSAALPVDQPRPRPATAFPPGRPESGDWPPPPPASPPRPPGRRR